MKLRIVGCSPAWPNPGGAHSGYLLEGGKSLLLDCGPGVLGKLREREQWPDVDAIAITHFHLDHWGDLVPWVWGSMFRESSGEGTGTPELWLPPGGRATLAALGERLGTPDMFERTFACAEYEDGVPFSAAGCEVTALHVEHYDLLAFGFRVERDGATVAYSGDSGPARALVELARAADLFLCEATLRDGRLETGLRGHLSAEEAVSAFEQAGAERLLLTHRPAELPIGGGLEQARDGLELDFPDRPLA